ncbi:uncharacterized protein [Phaseolus vulgaris]|uniref:uncharacterized protein n=1 Tax=Phaseolus vulgaris TaxID=3885 RepID=UPI0035CA987E
MEDPEAQLAAYHTQMMLVGGSDATRCKLFMSTLAGTAMEWFMSLPDGHVTLFPQLTNLFRAQYLANQAPPSVSYDLFNVKQYQGESLKESLHRFLAQVVRLNLTKEKMMVHAFRKGILSGPFSESLIRNHPKTFAEIKHRAVAHITTKEELSEKRTCVVPTRPRAADRPQTLRVHEATTEMKAPVKEQPYQRPNTRGRGRDNAPPRHDFIVELKDLIAMPNIVERLKVPPKTDKKLGPNKNAWCEFHQEYDHPIRNCLALGHQLDELVKSSLLRDYLLEKQGTEDAATTRGGPGHEVPVHGEVHTIVGGFSSEGCTASQRRRYARTVMSVKAQRTGEAFDVDLVFTKVDLEDVFPHDNDPVVISAVTAGRKVHRVLVD